MFAVFIFVLLLPNVKSDEIFDVVLEDTFFGVDGYCTSKSGIPLTHRPFFNFDKDLRLVMKASNTALTFNLLMETNTLSLSFSTNADCNETSVFTLYWLPRIGREIMLVNFTSILSDADMKYVKKGALPWLDNKLSCTIPTSTENFNCCDSFFECLRFDIPEPFTLYKSVGTTSLQLILKYVSIGNCPPEITITNAHLMSRHATLKPKVQTTPKPTEASTPITTKDLTTKSTSRSIILATTTKEPAVQSAKTYNKVIVIVFSVIGSILLLMGLGVGVYFIYKRCSDKPEEPAPYVPSSRSLNVSVRKPISISQDTLKTITPEIIMDPKDEDKTQSLSLRLEKEQPTIVTTPASVAPPTPALTTQPSLVTVDRTKSPAVTAFPKTEKEKSKPMDLPLLVVEKTDNYTKIKKTDFERGQEDSMASEEACGANIHKLEPLVMITLPLADTTLEKYPPDYVEKMALRKATIAERAAMHLQAITMASNLLLVKGFKNDGKTLTGSNSLMTWLRQNEKAPFLQFVAECVEVCPDVSSAEFNASKIQWRRYLRKIDIIETYRQSCWLGQSNERREFFLLATFFKLELLTQQYSSDDLKLYPYPVSYLLEVRRDAPNFFKIENPT